MRRASARSEPMAASNPGYWTFTATARPSASWARCTWPMEAAATGTGSHRRNSLAGSAPRSWRTTWAASSADIGVTWAWSWESDACASSGRPSTTNDSIWPSFMAAPFIWPSWRLTSSAERISRASSSSARRDRPANTPRARVATRSTPRRTASPASRARRAQREATGWGCERAWPPSPRRDPSPDAGPAGAAGPVIGRTGLAGCRCRWDPTRAANRRGRPRRHRSRCPRPGRRTSPRRSGRSR